MIIYDCWEAIQQGNLSTMSTEQFQRIEKKYQQIDLI